MKLIRCNNGHVFNAQAHQSCPYCSISNVDVGVLSKVDDAIVLENSNKTLAYWIKEVIKLKYPLNIIVLRVLFFVKF